MAVVSDELVERHAELDALHRWWQEAVAGHGRAVLVAGDAGSGKTSLVQRFRAELSVEARVWLGLCEPVETPPPLGPILDMAPDLPPDLSGLLTGPHDPIQLRGAFLSELTAGPIATLVVVEDAHWADAATLDLLRYAIRRLDAARAMVVITYRQHDVGPRHPLRVLAGDLSGLRLMRRLDVPPLTPAAIATLAAGSGLEPGDLFTRTGGNAFYVTEILASGGEVSDSVRDAVLARAARLDPAAHRVLEAAACIAHRAPPALIAATASSPPGAVDDCVEAGLLVDIEGEVAYRHDIARVAIADAIPPGRSRDYHAASLETLQGLPVEPARLVQHAERAGDRAAVARWTQEAARRAAALGAHREAAAHFRRALDASADLTDHHRAELLEGYAVQCLLADQPQLALDAWRAAVDSWERCGDRRRQSTALVYLTHTAMMCPSWMPIAEAACRQAFEVLEPLPPGPELALAISNVAKIDTLAFRNAEAIAAADRALSLAEATGADLARVFAVLLGGIARSQQGDERALESLDEAVQLAVRGGWPNEAGLAYFWAYHVVVSQHEPEAIDRWYGEGRAFVDEHDQEVWREWLRAWRARVLLDRGQWDEAGAVAADVYRRAPVDDARKVVAMSVLGRLAVRRGEPGAADLLEAIRTTVQPGEHLVGWIVSPAGALAEAAWYRGDVSSIPQLLATPYEQAQTTAAPWWLGELAWWLHRCGALGEQPAPIAEPYALQLAGRWRDAADAWRAIGCPFNAAVALTDADDADALREALAIFDRLGARPARDEAASRLRRLGVHAIPRPPRAAPAPGDPLTTREAQVLALLADGLRNAEIADQFFLSERTVEHHVANILRKLDVHDRAEAGRWARRRGITPDLGGEAAL